MRDADQRGDGYATAIAGAFLGGLTFGVAAYLLVSSWITATAEIVEAQATAVVLLAPAVAASAWLGSSLGCWSALRVRGHARAGRTAGLLTPLMLAGAVLSVLLFFSPINSLAPVLLFFVILVVVPAGVVTLARSLALRR